MTATDFTMTPKRFYLGTPTYSILAEQLTRLSHQRIERDRLAEPIGAHMQLDPIGQRHPLPPFAHRGDRPWSSSG